MKRRKNRRKSVFGWWRGERRVKIVGAWEFSHRAHSLGWNGFLLNLREKIGRKSRFDEKLSTCDFPLNLHCFLFSFFFSFYFWKKKLSSSTFLFLYAIKFFLSNVNLYHLYFLYSHFFLSKIKEFLFLHFSPTTKHYEGELKSLLSFTFSSPPPFFIPPLFHSPNQTKRKSTNLCKFKKVVSFTHFTPNISHINQTEVI